MGFDVANVGAFLGGANQGVGQGMDLYAKYDELKTKNEARAKQRAMEQKVQELAQTGLFKTDPVAATKQLGQFAAENGSFDLYSQYTKTAEELQRADQQKSGMDAFAGSLVSYQEGARHLNDWAKKGNMPNQFEVVNNPDNTVTVLGMGTDPKVGKKYSSLQDFHNDTLTMLAPTMLGPEKMMEFEADRGYKLAQTHAQEASAGHAEAETESVEAHTPQIAAIDRANIGQSEAAAGASRASAGLASTQAADIVATRGPRLGEIGARARGQELENIYGESTLAPRINEATTKAAAAMREEDQAQAISPDVVGAARAKLAGETAANQWKGPEAAARVALIEKQEQVAGLAKGSAQTKADLGSFIDEETVPGVTVPYSRRAENVAPLYAYIKAETGAAGTDAAAMASDVAAGIETAAAGGAGMRLDPARGTITMSNNRVLKVGERAVRRAKAMYDEQKARRAAAEAAGAG